LGEVGSQSEEYDNELLTDLTVVFSGWHFPGKHAATGTAITRMNTNKQARTHDPHCRICLIIQLVPRRGNRHGHASAHAADFKQARFLLKTGEPEFGQADDPIHDMVLNYSLHQWSLFPFPDSGSSPFRMASGLRYLPTKNRMKPRQPNALKQRQIVVPIGIISIHKQTPTTVRTRSEEVFQAGHHDLINTPDGQRPAHPHDADQQPALENEHRNR
jgi:hypothetical protein